MMPKVLTLRSVIASMNDMKKTDWELFSEMLKSEVVS